ncbi:hypothetical protein MCP1_820003 [Candidatus Terasakiella magnetica]|nr:hypothetical protein MCP1_820003 [Candidatus Terasakiella magnetica]
MRLWLVKIISALRRRLHVSFLIYFLNLALYFVSFINLQCPHNICPDTSKYTSPTNRITAITNGGR